MRPRSALVQELEAALPDALPLHEASGHWMFRPIGADRDTRSRDLSLQTGGGHNRTVRAWWMSSLK
jgi:hypothetical protein